MEKIKSGNRAKKNAPVPEIQGQFILPDQESDNQPNSRWVRFVLKVKAVIPPYIFFMASLYVVQMLIFQVFRFVFFYSNYDKIDPASFKYLELVLYFGFRFDTIVTCSILLVPFVILTIDYFFEWNRRWIYRLIKIYLRVLLILTFLICSADIPFFSFFNTRLTTSAFLWKDNSGDVVRFILSDSSKYPYLIFLLLASMTAVLMLWRLQGRLFNENQNLIPHPLSQKLKIAGFFSLLLIVGLRGGLSTNPLSIRHLTYTNHYFINQLSWNPVISFFDSFNTFPITYLDQQAAIKNTVRYLGGEPGYRSPIARKIGFSSPPLHSNVILVMMESMSGVKMGTYGNNKNLTPNLDALARGGLSFSNVYSAGIHTCNGIYGTLFSFPSLMAEHPMNNLNSTHQKFSGLYQTLSQNNYQSLFICTNDENFDNMGYFVKNNGCQYVYGMKDYPKDKIVNTWGPADETLFEFSIDKINRLYENKTPFFATLVTITAHEPYTIPSSTTFKSHYANKIDRAYEYADWSIGRFMDDCRKQPWFNNTIFVFIGDHGVNSNTSYEIPLSFHHTPLIIYSPALIGEPATIEKIGIQTDVFPTIMGLLRIPYVNNTFGIDLLREQRPCAYFSHDDKLGCINEDYFLIVDKSGKRSIYQYGINDNVDYIGEKKHLADSMQTYAMSMMQTAQWMLLNKLAGPQLKNYVPGRSDFSIR